MANLWVPCFNISDDSLLNLSSVFHFPPVLGSSHSPCHPQLITEPTSLPAVLLVPLDSGRGAGVLRDDAVLFQTFLSSQLSQDQNIPGISMTISGQERVSDKKQGCEAM